MASDNPHPWRRLRRHLLVVCLVSVAVLFVLAVAIEGMLWMRYGQPRSEVTEAQRRPGPSAVPRPSSASSPETLRETPPSHAVDSNRSEAQP